MKQYLPYLIPLFFFCGILIGIIISQTFKGQ